MKFHNERMTFYPSDFINDWDGFPKFSDFKIIQSEKIGLHVISSKDFFIGQVVFVFSGQLITKRTLRSLQITNRLHIHDPYFMGYIAHSCDPNCSVNTSDLSFTCIKKIKSGDIITMDYNETETNLFRSFKCSCGSKKCRKLIS
tara:strand:+ start:301 stop:732 length:432 start_codon:yes stop_codon:yes gene_type:complete